MVTIEIFKRMYYYHPGVLGEGPVALRQCSDDSAFLVRFEGYAHPFLVLEYRCSAPQCTCNTLSLEFTEINEAGHPIARPIQFSISLDVSTWKEDEQRERGEAARHFADLFLGNLTDDIKRQIRKSFDGPSGDVARSSTFKMPVEEIKNGTMTPYREVFGEANDTEPGKVQLEFAFQYRGKIYLIEDRYCMNPACDCAKVHLGFLGLNEDKTKAHEIFICEYSFEDDMEIREVVPPLTGRQAAKLFETWKANQPGFLEQLKERYPRMKEVGRQLLEENEKDKPSATAKKKSPGKKRKKKKKK